MTRNEHLDWCKQRATEYLDQGDIKGALASMMSDLQKHDETRNHAGVQLGMMLLISGNLETEQAMRDFILGFN